ncbi:MAG TPA: SLATT domain-containing protein [Opitutaceae bacterium]|nr:SLATT domain-containing protein [Opitutaceae bacterium]HRJ46894.1 SLATT domain-containing protein [Opitutaceae bacterium]
MDPHFQTDDTKVSRKVLEGQLRECFGRVVYSHKTHEKCADILLEKWARIKLAQIGCATISTGGFIVTIFGVDKAGLIIGTIVSTLLLVINAYVKDYDLGEIAQKHKNSACDLWLIRERYLSLITDLVMGERPIESLQRERDVLQTDLHAIYQGAPPTNTNAYHKAQDALKNKEDLTFSDKEIDAFLPTELKRDRKQSDGVQSDGSGRKL